MLLTLYPFVIFPFPPAVPNLISASSFFPLPFFGNFGSGLYTSGGGLNLLPELGL